MRLVEAPDSGPDEFAERIHPDDVGRIARSALAGHGGVLLALCGSWPTFESTGLAGALVRESGASHPVRLLLPRSALTTAELRQVAQLATRGADVRLTTATMPDAVIVGADIIAADPRPNPIHVRSQTMSNALTHLHDALWAHAVDLTAARRADALRADATRARVLAYLGSGALDDTAAREMDISVRTYRRYVARLLADLTVMSRFQAGVRAAELGLTEVEPPELTGVPTPEPTEEAG